ncbi:ATP-binding cassette domain-containing protein [Streptomyces sp. SID12501]|uniref:ABC transporter ATP-binding protein n=1 Tax=Streptomyces sp. SID12501 TaxID=2706042 RepID=A0A6B3BNE3_9ACTN|nr:ABC transporter ATP-binding protein [Streptomyces sp. SID12501]
MTALEVDNLTKRYGAHLALDSLSLRVESGNLFGFVGSNGAGKTTTMRIVVGLLAADSGHVRWDNAPLPAAGTRFGYMPEERGLYPKMTVAAQLTYLARLHGLTSLQARQAMLGWTDRLRITQHRDSPVDSLSLGNQQRVQLAAALVHEPDVLVLDEPFSGLDPLAVDAMSEVLKEKAAEGIPVLFSSHQLELVERLCDQVAIVRSGRLAACGSLEELRGDSRDAPLVVHVEGAEADWPLHHTDAISTFKRHEDGISLIVQAAPGQDENIVLRAAMQHGTVRRLTRERPTLTQLFRDLVEPHGFADLQNESETSK